MFFGFGGCDQSYNRDVDDENIIASRVAQIHFDGLDRTKHDILQELVKPILQSTDLPETLMQVNFVRQRFYELGLFRNVQVSVDTINKDSAKNDDGDQPVELAITFNVEETRRYAGSIFCSGNHNEVSGNVELRSPNLFGRGEEIRCQFEHSLRYYATYSTTFSKPLIRTPWKSLRSSLDLTMLQLSNYCQWSGYKQLNRNLLLGLNIQPHPLHRHLFQWETSWRYLSGLGQADFEIIEQFDHSLKSSISHTYTYDKRDNAVLPTKGSMFKMFNEYAGFQKLATSFRKHEFEFQHNLASFLQLSFKGGAMKSYNNTTVSDKFFLGGPLNLRGFQMCGVGPHGKEGLSALGALKYWVGAVHFQYPLPFKNIFDQYLRLHGFLQAGSISNKLSELGENIRTSCGGGLIFAFGNNVRLELNYCLPLFNQSYDKIQRGIHFGIGMTYV
ncbi:sorting and assembly machinery component 50 homolog B [Dermatophagoides pteronyssinus]|uniref:sorting and assembly machinery component 50 homolog B n=1 Tax=Dermatophagoides pteronyssinus TaxID=6956 RepID=UPI003F674004